MTFVSTIQKAARNYFCAELIPIPK